MLKGIHLKELPSKIGKFFLKSVLLLLLVLNRALANKRISFLPFFLFSTFRIVKNGMSPVTRTPIKIEDLYPNTAIKALLDEEKAKDETSIHPAIRKWRNEKPPERMIRSADIEASTRPYFPSLDDENEAINQRIARYDNVIRCVFASTIITFILFYFVRDNLVMAGIFFFFGFMRWFEYCVQRRRGRPRIYY